MAELLEFLLTPAIFLAIIVLFHLFISSRREVRDEMLLFHVACIEKVDRLTSRVDAIDGSMNRGEVNSFTNSWSSMMRYKWVFPYTGAELCPHVSRMLRLLDVEEESLRNEPEAEDRTNRLGRIAARKAHLVVWLMEFSRNPHTLFSLTLDDVIFFGMFGREEASCRTTK